ncbi:MAG TPA: response regulator transcription factor, partial [Polyangiaceae bacterium]|nr:response regulator transcription factor [Polyangiaceae bacterium]
VLAEDASQARLQFDRGVDLVVLDLRLPDAFGLELCREWRTRGSATPILVLSALSAVSVRVAGLDAGADDFLAKPFAVAELRARVRALGRRGALARSLLFVRGDVALDFAGRVAKRGEQAAPITSKEWSILELLARSPGRVVTRNELLEGVWGEISESSTGSLEVLVARLRRKLGAEFIRTLRGEGYALSEVDVAAT